MVGNSDETHQLTSFGLVVFFIKHKIILTMYKGICNSSQTRISN